MNNDLLIKCFIAFCVGAIIYKFISDRCSCGIVEGQEGSAPPPSQPPLLPNPDQVELDATQELMQQQTGSNNRFFEPVVIPGAALSNIDIETVKDFIDDLNENIFKKSIKENIDKIVIALNSTNTPIPEIPDSIDKEIVTTFEQFAEVPDALDYLELIIMTISKLDSTNFKKFIENLIQVSEYCSSDKDLNAHVISIILLQYYNIKLNSSNKYIVISNKLSKYIPNILENIQQLNIDCNNIEKTNKSNIMDTMIYRLFKNNNTVIKIGSIDSLISELGKLPKIYGVVLMLCISYIIVRFLGMFSMKVEV